MILPKRFGDVDRWLPIWLAEQHFTLQPGDFARETWHLLELSQRVEAASILPIADNLEAMPFQFRYSVYLFCRGRVNVDIRGAAHKFACSSRGRSAPGG